MLAMPPLALDRIEIREQPRTFFDAERLDDLTHSIQAHGVLEPVVVTPAEGGRYRLIAGERRVRAARAAGMTDIPAVVRPVEDDHERRLLALVENMQREALSPIEEARAFQTLAEEGMTDEEIGRAVGLSRPAVANRRRLLKLPEAVQALVARREIGVEDALAVLALPDPERTRAACDLRDGLTTSAELRSVARARVGAGKLGGEATAVLPKTEEAPVEEPSPDPRAGSVAPAAPRPKERERQARRMLAAVARRREGTITADPRAVALVTARLLSGTRLAAVHRMLRRLAGTHPLPFLLTAGQVDGPQVPLQEALATLPVAVQLDLCFWALVEEEAGLHEECGQRMERSAWYAGEEP